VAEGRPAPLGAQPALTPKGAAVECRLCAEDPDHGFAPSAGRLLAWHTPRLEGVRVDSGVDTGSEVSTHYDSLLAKLIAWGPDRPSALRRMQHTLRNTVALGVVTNRKLLLETLALPDFQNGHIHTETLNNFLRDKPHRAPEAPPVRLAAFAALAEQFSARRAKATHLPSVSAGFRNSRLGPEEVVFEHQGHPVSLSYTPAGNNKLALVETPEPLEVEVVHRAPPSLRLRVADRLITANVAADGHRLWVALEEQDVFFDERPRFPELTDTRTAGGCVSPLPGRVARVLVSVGEAVDAGAAIAVVEAMKMEHTLHAAGAGIVEELHAEPGDSIAAGAPIATIRPNEPPTPTTCS
jgi:acetyl/propionyl-CoA carboxylase alpha subunit